MIRTWLHHELTRRYPGTAFDVLVPPDHKMGDYSVNLAFALAKKEKKNPLAVAQEIADQFKDSEFFERIEAVAPGFVNFTVSSQFLQKELVKIHEHREHAGRMDIGAGKTVIVEYCGTNIAKPMHVGHLRSTIIGDALANVYDALGYKVIRWNYLGDWGTQFGKLIAAYKMWGDKATLQANPIGEMLRLYVKFHHEIESNPDLEKQGQVEFKKLEEGDSENRELWEWFRAESLKEFYRNYSQLGVQFDVEKGESAYEKDLAPLVAHLKEGGKIRQSEGAWIFDLEKYALPPALIQKTDGASLYITREIASLKNRIEEFHPAKILYVVANQQALHFEQLFAIEQELHLGTTELVHVKFGMVLGDDGKKLATREGKAVSLQEVMDKVTELAKQTVKEKNPNLSDSEAHDIAHTVGIAALKYNDLRQHPYSDIAFDWKAMLDLSGNSGPYLQYTYARLKNIVRKSSAGWLTRLFTSPSKPDVALLSEPTERALMRHLLDFSDAIEKSAHLHTLNALALYLYELANHANRYYEAVRILEDENKNRRDARLVLIETVAAVLKRGLELLGIKTLQRI